MTCARVSSSVMRIEAPDDLEVYEVGSGLLPPQSPRCCDEVGVTIACRVGYRRVAVGD